MTDHLQFDPELDGYKVPVPFKETALGRWQAWQRKLREDSEAEHQAYLDSLPKPTQAEVWAADLARIRKADADRAALIRFHAAKRRTAKMNRTPPWADMKAIRAFYDEAARLTKLTGEQHHVDHIYPLQGKLVSGLHVENNLQVIPWLENIVKRNKFEVET